MEQRTDFTFVSRRNDSLPGKARFLVLAWMLAPIACVGVLFALRGAWLIAAFAAIEIFALRIAFRAMQARSLDFDLVRIGNSEVCVRSRQQGHEQTFRCPRCWARLSVAETPAGTPGSLVMQAGCQRIEFGSHLKLEDRERLAGEINKLLAAPPWLSRVAASADYPGDAIVLLKEGNHERSHRS